MKRIILPIILCGLLQTEALADVYYEEQITTSGFAGKGATKLTRKVYIKGDRQKRLTTMEVEKAMAKAMRKAGRSLVTSDIIRLDRSVVWDLNHDEQTFTEQAFSRTAAQLMKLREAKLRAAKPVVRDTSTHAEPRVTFDLKRTGKKREILGFQCDQIMLTMTTVRTDPRTKKPRETQIVYDAWITKKFAGYREIRTFAKRQSETTGAPAFDIPGLDAMKATMGDALDKLRARAGELEGFTLRSTIGIYTGGRKAPIFTITREVVKVAQQPIIASEFEVPRDFSRVKAR